VHAERNAGFAEKSAHVEGSRLSKDPEVLLRISELIAKVAEVKAKVATNAFEAALAEIPASLGPKAVAAVATATRKRHYRLTVLQDVGCAAQATRASAIELGLEPEIPSAN
jgi:phage terminase small subunit